MNMHLDPFADLPPADDMPPDDRFPPMSSYAPLGPVAKSFAFVAVGDLKYSPPEFLVNGLIETDTLGLIFGDPGCGKSFMAVDIALCVASGADFHGHPLGRIIAPDPLAAFGADGGRGGNGHS